MRNAIIAISILAATASAAVADPRHDSPGPFPVVGASGQNVFAEPNQIARILQNEGYVAKLDKDDGGDPKIASSSQGAKWSLYFYGCTNHTSCKSVQFQSSFATQGRITLDQVNSWNYAQRYATALLDKVNDVTVKMDIQLAGGVPEEAFKANLGVWDSQLGGFLKHIGWK
jgi:Putative bacterial sensory transduction regulator